MKPNLPNIALRCCRRWRLSGGEFVIRGGHWTLVEGEWPRPRLVIIAFPSREAAEGWYKSAAYQKLLPLRLEASQSDLIIADGVA